MLLSEYISQVQFLVHDQSGADFTPSELTAAVNNARKAVAMDFHCCRVTYLVNSNSTTSSSPNYQPVSTIPNQELYSLVGPNGNNGQVVGAAVNSGGTGYTAATTVAFSVPPAGGIQATADVVVTNGAISQINMTRWGEGYLPALPGDAALPTMTFTDSGGGTGATATPTMFNSVFDVLSISYIWGNQRYMLAWRAFTLFQAYMRSQLFFTSRGIITTIQQQQGFVLIQPPPDQPYLTEWDVVCVDPIPLTNPGDRDRQIGAPYSDAVQYWAAYLCLMKLQNFQQAEFMLKLYEMRVPRIIIGAGGRRIPNPYSKTFQRRVSRG